TKQIGQVRVPARELHDRRLARRVEPGNVARGQPLAQPDNEPRPIEILALTDGAGILEHRGSQVLRFSGARLLGLCGSPIEPEHLRTPENLRTPRSGSSHTLLCPACGSNTQRRLSISSGG